MSQLSDLVKVSRAAVLYHEVRSRNITDTYDQIRNLIWCDSRGIGTSIGALVILAPMLFSLSTLMSVAGTVTVLHCVSAYFAVDQMDKIEPMYKRLHRPYDEGTDATAMVDGVGHSRVVIGMCVATVAAMWMGVWYDGPVFFAFVMSAMTIPVNILIYRNVKKAVGRAGEYVDGRDRELDAATWPESMKN